MMIRPATLGDAIDLAPRLRKTDVEEIRLLSGSTAKTALLHSTQRSDAAYAVEIDGRVEAMFGHRETSFGRAALVWALGSDMLPERKYSFIKEMRSYLDDVGPRYGKLVNLVEVNNHPSKRLLRRLGFSFGSQLPTVGGGVAQTFWRSWNV